MATVKSGLKRLSVALGVVVAVGIALSWYYFGWVASRRDYFRKRDFRQLATLSGQIQNKIDNFDNIMDNSWHLIKDWKSQKRALYFTNVDSDLEYQEQDELPKDVRSMKANDPPSLAIERDEGQYFLFFALEAPSEPERRGISGGSRKPEVSAKGFPMNRADELTTLVKRVGSFAGLCKRVSAGAHGDITERELALLAKGYAMNEYPALSPDQAFNKKFGAERMSGEARAFWDACAVAKGSVAPARLEPTRGADADDLGEVLRQYAQLLREQRQRTRLAAAGEDDEDEESDEDALDEITEKARKLRKSMPHLSEAQAFTKAYEQNRELAKRERRQNGF